VNIKALIASLALLGSSSVAMARPAASVSVGANASWSFGWSSDRNADRDHRHYTPPADPVYRPDTRYPVAQIPQPLPPQPVIAECNNTRVGADTSSYIGTIGASNGRWFTALTEPTRIDAGREFFTLGADAGRFEALKLQAVRGSSYIQQVAVIFKNGRTQVIKVERALDGRNPTLMIDLDGNQREIGRIVVYGSTAPRSAYQILAV
jgi:hypothetical protein